MESHSISKTEEKPSRQNNHNELLSPSRVLTSSHSNNDEDFPASSDNPFEVAEQNDASQAFADETTGFGALRQEQ